MKITEAADYILGRKFMEGKRKQFRGTSEVLELGRKLVDIYPTMSKNLNLLESDTIFYKMEPDVFEKVPKEMREELFYSMKLNQLSSIVPAKTLYFLDKCYKLYGSMNLLPRVIPASYLKQMFTEGHLAEGYNLRDVICSLYDEKYKPISDGDLVVPNRDNWDIYIEETDMVAIIPTEIKEKLTYDDIKRLQIKNKQIVLGELPIRFLSDKHIGATNSIYDLSTIV